MIEIETETAWGGFEGNVLSIRSLPSEYNAQHPEQDDAKYRNNQWLIDTDYCSIQIHIHKYSTKYLLMQFR